MKYNKYTTITILLSVAFFFAYAWLSLNYWLPQLQTQEHLIFNWPDANANYFFSSLYSESGQLFQYDTFNTISSDLIHTRSVNVLNGSLVPIGFLVPVILFGIAMFFGKAVGLLLTPAMAALSVYLAYVIIKKVFKDEKLAFFSGLLLLPLAPWMYFSNFVMLPTIMLIFFLLLGWNAILKSWEKNESKESWWNLGILMILLAIAIRPTEIVWILSSALLVFYWQKSKISTYRIYSAIGLSVFMGAVVLLLNNFVYGSYFSFGYINFQDNSLPNEFASKGVNYFKLLLAPFGINMSLIFKNIFNYIFEIIPSYVVLATGGIIVARCKSNKLWLRYIILSGVVSLLLLVYYASWDLADSLVKDLNNISISYVRYFMPIYLFVIPLAALALQKLFWKNNILNQVAIYIIILALALGSFKVAFLSKNDGLLATYDTLQFHQEQFLAVQQIAAKDSIMITDRTDKVFFPYYKVVVPQEHLPLWPRAAKLLRLSDIYYFTDKDISVDQETLSELNLRLVEEMSIDNFILYKLTEK